VGWLAVKGQNVKKIDKVASAFAIGFTCLITGLIYFTQ